MSFSIALKPLTGECNRIDEFHEGVEFSLQLLSKPEEWIPIRDIYIIIILMIVHYNQLLLENPVISLDFVDIIK